MLTLLNTSIVTVYGSYEYRPSSVDEAADLVASNEWQSAIGHQSTADILSELLGVDCQVNRIAYEQQPGQIAIVFKLRDRAPEGVILSRNQIEEIGYDFGILERIS